MGIRNKKWATNFYVPIPDEDGKSKNELNKKQDKESEA